MGARALSRYSQDSHAYMMLLPGKHLHFSCRGACSAWSLTILTRHVAHFFRCEGQVLWGPCVASCKDAQPDYGQKSHC